MNLSCSCSQFTPGSCWTFVVMVLVWMPAASPGSDPEVFWKENMECCLGKTEITDLLQWMKKQNTPSILFGCCFHGNSKICFHTACQQEVELAGSKAVDYVDFDDAMDDCGGRAPFPCSHSRCHEFHENVHGFCPKHRLLRHWWKLASWWRTAPWPVVFSCDVL